MEPELECRRNPGRCWLPLPWEEREPLRTMRFVTVSPTGVGVVVCVRSAAAAAAEERAPLDSRSRRKAFVAAREADALAGLLGACIWACYVSGASTRRAIEREGRGGGVRHVRGWTRPVVDCAAWLRCVREGATASPSLYCADGARGLCAGVWSAMSTLAKWKLRQ